MTRRTGAEAPPARPKRRNLQIVAMRRLGQKIKPSAKRYTRKGRIKDPALSRCDRAAVTTAGYA